MSAKGEILARVRGAVADITTPAGQRPAAAARDSGGQSDEGTLELFSERVADYRATVVRAAAGDVPATIADALAQLGCQSVVVPSGLDAAWTASLGDAVTVLPEAEATSHAQLDAVDAVVTAARVGIAVTGTIVLDHGPDQGRRELTLVPDTHVCVIGADQVVPDVPDAVARLRPAAGAAQPLTWISGPSATSDIELNRVEGVHGPRNLVVIITA
ncbi:lactate utilization protein C [Intrasporangium calvum]|uniref:Lactate utilization protein C n=1 Tax=Intrasporangium calvum TaxID=53358 RepID=A0ABT5GH92_9MICO|nr:lactate utilization protein C [Intrasporangium calvum]MDC5697081.1 lactate utilization protein C [Intrasporangium calvum]